MLYKICPHLAIKLTVDSIYRNLFFCNFISIIYKKMNRHDIKNVFPILL